MSCEILQLMGGKVALFLIITICSFHFKMTAHMQKWAACVNGLVGNLQETHYKEASRKK